MKLPRFNLRDLFWLVLVVGMACAWWFDRSLVDARHRSRLRYLTERIEETWGVRVEPHDDDDYLRGRPPEIVDDQGRPIKRE